MAFKENEKLTKLLKYEADKNYCREVVQIAKGQNLKMGAIIAESAGDTYEPVKLVTQTVGTRNPTTTTVVSGNAYGVLIEDVDATGEAKPGMIVSRDVIVNADLLIMPTSATEAHKKTIRDALGKRGIVLKTEA